MNEKELFEALQNLKAEYHAKAADLVPAEIAEYTASIREANDAYIAALIDGCQPCDTCGSLPHGIRQPNHVEIGCLTCRHDDDHGGDALRVRGFTRDQAVQSWNSKDWWLGNGLVI